MDWNVWRCSFRVENVYDLDWDGVPSEEGGKSYGDIFHRAELNFQPSILNMPAQMSCSSILRMQKLNALRC